MRNRCCRVPNLACETARKKGGNCIHQHDPVTEEKAGRERDEQWTQRVRDALEKNEFWLVYQPIASLHGETQEKYEVLVRMADEEGNEVLPGQFLPAAENANLIGEVDRWVMRRAIEVLTERRRGGHDTVFFIKLSVKTVSEPTLLSWISEQLKAARLQGDTIVFELSEAAAVTNLKQAKAFHGGLQELRCGLALEHFGSGVNSLQLLKHLPADYLKIDGSFMHNLAGSAQNQEMVKSITETAHSMGKTTIAEYVEDASSLAVLWQCGVNYIQGHFLQSPGEEMNFDFQGEEALDLQSRTWETETVSQLRFEPGRLRRHDFVGIRHRHQIAASQWDAAKRPPPCRRCRPAFPVRPARGYRRRNRSVRRGGDRQYRESG